MTDTRVNAIVELLEARAPNSLGDLRRRFPAQSAVLAPGQTFGRTSKAEKEEALLICQLAEAGLKQARLEIKAILANLPIRAARAKSIRLTGSIVAAVVSAGVVSSAIFGPKELTIVTALLSFAATSVGLIAAYLETPLFGKNGLGDLIEECLLLETAAKQAELALISGTTSGQCQTTATTVNEICSKLRRISIFGGISPDAAPSH